MTNANEPRPRTADATLRFWVIAVVSAITGMLLALTVVIPWLDSALDSAGQETGTTSSVQDTSSGIR